MITTTNTLCECPPDALRLAIGVDKRLNGPHLPKRLIDTIQGLLDVPWRILIVAEYDCLILKRLQVENMNPDAELALYLAGGQTQGSIAQHFYHVPWVFRRDAAIRFVEAGRRILDKGICSYGSPESSPDVFVGLIVERFGFKLQTDLWRQYSRNSFDRPGHLEEARQAYRDGVDVIHGCKTAEELAFITT